MKRVARFCRSNFQPISMQEIVKRALKATKKSKHIDFKPGFDPASPGEWCEIIKDIVAIANCGGGILVFGLDSMGRPTGASLDAISREDAADMASR